MGHAARSPGLAWWRTGGASESGASKSSVVLNSNPGSGETLLSTALHTPAQLIILDQEGRVSSHEAVVPRGPLRTQGSAAAGGGRGRSTWETMPTATSGGLSALGRAIQAEVLECRSLDELEAVLSCHTSELSYVNVSTAWWRLAKILPRRALAPGLMPTMSPDIAALVQLLVGKTLGTVHYMTLREVSNCLWSMRKLSVRLESQPHGHHLAELIEGQLLDLAEGGGLASGTHAEQIWYCFSAPSKASVYPWSDKVVSYLAAASLRHLQDWETRSVAQVCLHWGRGGIQLTAEQQETLSQAVVAGVAQQQGQDGMQQFISLDHWLTGCVLLSLMLPTATVKALHDRLLAAPELIVRELGIVEYSTTLKRVLDLGYQPAAVEAEMWRLRLLDPLLGGDGNRLSLQDLTSALLALSYVAVLVPDEGMLEAFQLCVQARRRCSREDARRMIAIKKQWGLRLTDAEYGALKRLATAS
ncbi:hypothetical protein TSOC_004540 [Tetrabaena socialis]|uniref:Uncharacterized protein n=1 Tax=Tetrabaena socialis TaxID=47790 RepID=A0A2J8A8N7_9CHLO|nr:hypothetical protein TSOC_004540 [Tetrabaena socialis]|eukprot:PNH08889.1 hypothetical protein TSOC_004540 [Tetrabaena socialis]